MKPTEQKIRSAILKDAAAIALIALIVVLSIVNLRPGHDWGDDFALYLRQGQGLVEGNVGEVLATNRYMVQESSGPGFSPYSYPWGWPLLLSPVVAVWGLDFMKLKFLEIAFFAGFLFFFYKLVARRTSKTGGVVVTALLGFSVDFVGWTDTVLAQLPFLCFVALSLYWLDRIAEKGLWATGPTRPLLIAGVLIAFTTNIRREGAALVLGLAAAQAVYLWRRRREGDQTPVPWKRLGLPYAGGFGFAVGLQLLLPTVVVPSYENTGLHNIWPNAVWLSDRLGEQIGLRDPGTTTWDYLGSHQLALLLFYIFLGCAAIGLLLRIVTRLGQDAHLIGYLFGVSLFIGVLPFHESRYLHAITPFLAYFAFQGIAVAVRVLQTGKWRKTRLRRALPTAVAAVVISVFTLGNITDLFHKTYYRIDYGGWTHWGPEDPNAIAMFDAVKSHTRRDEVLSFSRARAMTLFTERTTLQLTNLDHILTRADWYVMAKDSTYVQVLLTPEEAAEAGLVSVWENDVFVLWRVPDPPEGQTSEPNV